MQENTVINGIERGAKIQEYKTSSLSIIRSKYQVVCDT